MANRSKSKRKKGPQTPEKYPIPVGNNYEYWGEQAGYIYDPWSDKYLPDPRLQNQYGEQTGLMEKKEKPKEPPGPWEQGAAATLPQLVSMGGLLALKHYLNAPDASANLPYQEGEIYDYPGGPLDATSASGGVYPQSSSGLIDLGVSSTPEIYGPPEPSSYEIPTDNSSWLNDLYQGSWLQSGLTGLANYFGY